ncbi:hypothetical protein ACFL2H_00165 [Planctomycetota bacterium]
MRTRIPSYRRHKSGQARVTLNGRDHFLGLWNSEPSKKRYEEVVAEWLAGGRKPLEPVYVDVSSENTVVELIAKYMEFA